MKYLRHWSDNRQRGTTGIEAALIIGVLATAASVFAYVIMSAGLISSQRTRDVVNNGVESASTTLELKSNVTASMENGVVTKVYLTLGTLPGGTSLDFTDTSGGQNKVIISCSDASHEYPSLNWTMEMIGQNNGDSLLDPGETCRITVDMSPVNDGAESKSEKLVPFHKFMLELTPPTGATLMIEKTIPSTQNHLVNLN